MQRRGVQIGRTDPDQPELVSAGSRFPMVSPSPRFQRLDGRTQDRKPRSPPVPRRDDLNRSVACGLGRRGPAVRLSPAPSNVSRPGIWTFGESLPTVVEERGPTRTLELTGSHVKGRVRCLVGYAQGSGVSPMRAQPELRRPQLNASVVLATNDDADPRDERALPL